MCSFSLVKQRISTMWGRWQIWCQCGCCCCEKYDASCCWYGRGWRLTMVPGINTNRQNTNFYFVRASIGRILAGLKSLGREKILRSHSAPVVTSNLMRGNSEADTTTTTITMMIFVMTDYLMNFVIMLMIWWRWLMIFAGPRYYLILMIDDICRPQRQYTGWLGRLMTGQRGRLASSKYVKMLIMMSSIIIKTMVMMMLLWWWCFSKFQSKVDFEYCFF